MNVRQVEIQERNDIDGSLGCIEYEKDIPFSIKRVFYIDHVNRKSVRGNHACYNAKFALLILNGKAVIELDDGIEKIVLKMRRGKAILIDNNIWFKIFKFSSDSMILVLSDKVYTEALYIQDYEQFKNLIFGDACDGKV